MSFYVVSLCFLKTDCVQYLSNLMIGNPKFHDHIIEFVVQCYQITPVEDLKVYEGCLYVCIKMQRFFRVIDTVFDCFKESAALCKDSAKVFKHITDFNCVIS